MWNDHLLTGIGFVLPGRHYYSDLHKLGRAKLYLHRHGARYAATEHHVSGEHHEVE